MNPFEQAFRAYTTREGGQMHQRGSFQQQTFCYATFPIQADIQPSDSIVGGLVLKIVNGSTSINAFILRQVCTNGMVAPYWLREASREVSEVTDLHIAMEETLSWVREKGVHELANRFRRTMRRKASPLIWDSISIQMMQRAINGSLMAEIRREAHQESHRRSSYASLLKRRWSSSAESLSYFDVINGVTAVARDQKNPETQWKLMQLGWSLLVGQQDESPTSPPPTRIRREYRRQVQDINKELSL